MVNKKWDEHALAKKMTADVIQEAKEKLKIGDPVIYFIKKENENGEKQAMKEVPIKAYVKTKYKNIFEVDYPGRVGIKTMTYRELVFNQKRSPKKSRAQIIGKVD